ncbi:MAG: TIGR00297 family protein, partial [Methanocorpusculum sp.]|nr:TIGR00297 family protein [Methanocorpusculum sp.]
MDSRLVQQLILVIVTTTIMLLSTQFPPIVVGCMGVAFAVVLYFTTKIRYFGIGIAVLGLLYGIQFIPVSAFVGPIMMIVWGEVFRSAFDRFSKSIFVFGIGSGLALFVTMLYTNEFEPLVGVIALIVLLMLRSILKDRDDGAMISLIGVAMTIALFEDLQFFVDYRTLAFAVALCAAFGYFAYRAKTIDLSGVFTAVLFGVILIIFANVMWFFVVMLFFILGSIFTKFKYAKKKKMGVEQRKSGRRGYMNAFANTGVGVAAAVLYGISGGDMIFAALFLGSIATATADTMASEIGVVGGVPRLITTFKKCEPGTNGGVTIVGEAACLAGSIIVCGIAFALGIVSWQVCLICIIVGFIGTNLDSLYGALIENRGLIGNSGTNLLATLSGGLIALLIYVLLSANGL